MEKRGIDYGIPLPTRSSSAEMLFFKKINCKGKIYVEKSETVPIYVEINPEDSDSSEAAPELEE